MEDVMEREEGRVEHKDWNAYEAFKAGLCRLGLSPMEYYARINAWCDENGY